MSWPSYRLFPSNLHESSQLHSPFVRTSARIWFQRWTDVNLPTPPNPDPQDHLGLIGVLTDVATPLHTEEALCPVVASQSEAEKDTKKWDCLPPTSQIVILAASATTRTYIPISPPPTIHQFLNARNWTTLHDNFSLTYTGKNIYLTISFYQDLLQGHIMAIPNLDSSTGLSPLLTPPYSAGSANAQQRAMQIQVLLSMGQDTL